MKRFFYLFAIVLAVTFIASCGNSNKQRDVVKEFQNGLTSEDTASVLNLSDSCMELLKQQKYDEALAMLSEYDDSTGTLVPLSEELRASYMKRFKLFPVVSYFVSGYIFKSEGINDVKYEVAFGEPDPKTGNTPKTSFMFNPVLVEGQWYLTVKQADNEITGFQ